MKLKINDQVVVIAGSHKGQVGKILKINDKKNTVVVKDINIVTKHVKPSQQKTDGSIERFEAPIHASNVALLLKKATKDKPNVYTKIGYKVVDGKKTRIARKTGKAV